MGCLLLFASFLFAGSSGLDFLDPLLVAGFLTAGCSLDDSSRFDRLDPPLVVSLVFVASSLDDSSDSDCWDTRLLSFFTAGVWVFLAGAPLLTGVVLDADVKDSFSRTLVFLPFRLAEDVAFFDGDFLARVRPLPLAFD